MWCARKSYLIFLLSFLNIFLPELNIKAVVLGSRIRIITAAKLKMKNSLKNDIGGREANYV